MTEFKCKASKREHALVIGLMVLTWLLIAVPNSVALSLLNVWWGWLITVPTGVVAFVAARGLGSQLHRQFCEAAKRRFDAENAANIPTPVNVRLENADGSEKISLELRHLGADPFGGVGWGAGITTEVFERFGRDELELAADEMPQGVSITLNSPTGGIVAIPRPTL